MNFVEVKLCSVCMKEEKIDGTNKFYKLGKCEVCGVDRQPVAYCWVCKTKIKEP